MSEYVMVKESLDDSQAEKIARKMSDLLKPELVEKISKKVTEDVTKEISTKQKIERIKNELSKRELSKRENDRVVGEHQYTIDKLKQKISDLEDKLSKTHELIHKYKEKSKTEEHKKTEEDKKEKSKHEEQKQKTEDFGIKNCPTCGGHLKPKDKGIIKCVGGSCGKQFKLVEDGKFKILDNDIVKGLMSPVNAEYACKNCGIPWNRKYAEEHKIESCPLCNSEKVVKFDWSKIKRLNK